jgi:hypothetical protein
MPLLIAVTASAQGLDGNWNGRLRCDALNVPGQRPLDTAIRITIANGRAAFRRVVLNPDGSPTGIAEVGDGTVAADGSITLSGTANGPRYNYVSHYAGRLSAERGTGQLSGAQDWAAGQAVGGQRRPCTIGLRRTP